MGAGTHRHRAVLPRMVVRCIPNLTRRNSSGLREGKVVTEDLSEAFYAKSWMCGFTDAFNFDGFEKSFQK